MGFWNSVIYIVTSRAAIKVLFVSLFTTGKIPRGHQQRCHSVVEIRSPKRHTPRDSYGEDLERLAAPNSCYSSRGSSPEPAGV